MAGIAKYIFAIGILSLFISTSARAERPGDTNPYSYIVNQGQIAFSQGGGAFLPISVLQGLQQGSLSPVMQFVLVNQVMNQCITKVLQQVPYRRDGFVIANKKFTQGFCKIRKCFDEAMLLEILPQMSQNANFGGSPDAQNRASAQQMGLVLAQSFQKDTGCTAGADNGLDPSLLAAFNTPH